MMWWKKGSLMRWRRSGRTGVALALLVSLLVSMALPAPAMATSLGGLLSSVTTTGSTPTGTPAQSDPQTSDGHGGTKGCRTFIDAKGGTLMGVIVPCITLTMENATQNFSAQLIAYMEPVIWAFITLVIAMFGVKVLEGQPKPIRTEAFVLVFKIAFTIGILKMVPGTLVPATYDIMTEGQNMVAGTINSSSIHCNIDQYGDQNTPLIWKEVDCVLGKLYGITMGTRPDGSKGPNMLLTASAFGMLSGFMFGGSFGVSVFFAVIGVLFGIVVMVLRSAFSFINGYLYVMLMLILSPIFVPLMLFKPTQAYFAKWLDGVMGAMLVPVVVSSYVMFALLLYDKVLLAPDSMFQQLFDPAFTQAIQAPVGQKACDFHLTGNLGFRAAAEGKSTDETYNDATLPLFQNLNFPQLFGAIDPCALVTKPVLDLSQTKDASGNPYASEKEWFRDLFYDAIKIFITTLLINAGFTQALNMSKRFTGSYSAAEVATSGQITNDIQAKMTGLRKNMDAFFSRQVDRNTKQEVKPDKVGMKEGADPGGSLSGQEFLDRATGLPAAVPKTIMRGPMDAGNKK